MGNEFHPFKRIAQAFFDQAHGKVGDFNPDPLPPQLLRRMNRGPTAAERAEHYIAGVG